MEYNVIEEITNAGKSSYETLQKLGAINTKAFQQLAELQFDFAAYSIESGIEQGKLLSSTNSYKDLLNVESDFAEEYSAKAMDFSKKAASILSESQEEVVSLVEKEIEKVVKTTKPKAKAPAAKTTAAKAPAKAAAKSA